MCLLSYFVAAFKELGVRNGVIEVGAEKVGPQPFRGLIGHLHTFGGRRKCLESHTLAVSEWRTAWTVEITLYTAHTQFQWCHLVQVLARDGIGNYMLLHHYHAISVEGTDCTCIAFT